MTRTQFTFYESFFRSVARIKKAADRAKAYDIICAYALYGEEPNLDSVADSVAVAFEVAKPVLDASRRKAEGGKLGGSAKHREANPKHSEATRKQEKEKEQVKEQVLPPTPLPRFRPPTVDEVRAYCQEKGYPVDPARFVDYYAARGWSYGKGVPMKDWKAAVRTWVKSEPDSPSSPPSPRKYKTVLLDGEWVDVPDEEVEPDA